MLLYYWSKLLKKIRGSAIKNSEVNKTSKIEAGSLFQNSSMGKYSFCGYDCKIINTKIGSFCSIADGVVIGGAEHPISWVSSSPVFYRGRDSVKMKFSEFERPTDKQTIIGNDVWIGEKAIIKAGVHISTGAVIGMGAVVTHDVKPYEVVAGVPAIPIRKRFSDEIIEELLESKWWDLEKEILHQHSKDIRDPKAFLRGLKD